MAQIESLEDKMLLETSHGYNKHWTASACARVAISYAIEMLEGMKVENITGNVLVEVVNIKIENKITELKTLLK